MKRIAVVLLIIFLLILGSLISLRAFVKYAVKEQLAKVFTGSSVNIASCSIDPLKSISLSNIEIGRIPAYSLKIKNLTLSYSLFSLFKQSISKVSLDGVTLEVDLPKENPEGLIGYLKLNTGGPAFLIKSLELSDLNIKINLKGLSLNGNVFMGLDIPSGLIDYCRVKFPFLEINGARLENISLEKTRISPECILMADRFSYDKLKMNRILGKLIFKNKSLFIEPLTAELLDGMLSAGISIALDKNLDYLAELEFRNLSLEAFTDEFNLAEKARISGKLNGALSIKGKRGNINILGGGFNTLDPGGSLTIKDTRFLENMAKRSGQSMDLMLESFNNYGYNKGAIELSLEQGNLAVHIALNGNTGERNLDIILHDILK